MKNTYHAQANLKFKLLNFLSKKGKKTLAEKTLKIIFKSLQKKTPKNTKTLLKSALVNISPVINVKKVSSLKRRNKTVMIPIFLNRKTRAVFSMKSLIDNSLLQRNNNSITLPLEKIILESSSGTETKIKKNIYQLAHSNYSVAHYRWF